MKGLSIFQCKQRLLPFCRKKVVTRKQIRTDKKKKKKNMGIGPEGWEEKHRLAILSICIPGYIGW